MHNQSVSPQGIFFDWEALQSGSGRSVLAVDEFWKLLEHVLVCVGRCSSLSELSSDTSSSISTALCFAVDDVFKWTVG